MKRSLKLFILTLIIGVVAIFVSDVHAATYEHLYYSVENNEVTITGYDGTEINNLQIPSEIEGMPVTVIKSSAFFGKKNLKGDLFLPDTITTIGKNAFYNCTGLDGNIILSNNLVDIGEQAFYGCKNLIGDLIIPDSVTSIGEGAFWNCGKLDGKLKLSNSLTRIESKTFYNCESLTGSLVVPEGIEYIGSLAFDYCISLDGNISLPSGLKTIEKQAFSYCKSLTGDLILPTGLEYIGESTFYGCSSFEGTLVIPETVTYIGSRAFGDCKNITGEVNILGNLKEINDGIFYNCGKLTGKIEISDGVQSIGSDAFRNCTGFTGNLILPDSVTEIGSYAFYNCTGLDGYLDLSTSLQSIGSSAFAKSTNLTGSLLLPEGLKTIGNSAFSNCSNLDGEFSFASTITSLGERAFEYCGKLTGDITIPSQLTTIPYSCFLYCSSLDGELVIPKGVTTIEAQAFYGCKNLTGNLVIPDTVTTIDRIAFVDCKGFTGDLILPDSITKLENGAFAGCEGLDGKLVLSKNITAIYLNTFYATNFKGSVVIPEKVEEISTQAFYSCNSITEFIMTGNAPIIEKGSFSTKNIKCKYGTTGYNEGLWSSYYKVTYYDVPITDTTIGDIVDDTYTGEEINKNLEIKFDGKNLIKDKDYKVEYKNNINAGEATIEITGIGDYKDILTLKFNINSRDVKETNISEILNQIYNTDEIKPAINVQYGKNILVEGTDFTVEYKNNKNAGEASVIITGLGNYTSETEVKFKILPEDISKVDIEEIAKQIYTSKEITPKIKASYNGKELIEGTDYILTYENNIKSGIATIVVKGIGNYSGERKIQFVITADVNDLKISTISNQAYTGKAIEPKIVLSRDSVILERDKDYIVEYKNNVKLGIATVIITGIGDYSGTKSVTFKIVKNITSVKVSGIVDKTYTGSKQTQKLTVKYGKTILTKDKDYTLTYSNNVNKGTATITINGKGNYAGTKKVTFKIGAKSITKFTFSKVKDYTYTGKVIKPNVSVKNGKTTLTKDKDYTVSYKNNVNKGTATITITGKGNYTGTKKLTFKIKARSINSIKIEGLKSKTYTGKSQKQSLKLTYNNMTLVKDKDYILSYKNNINKGTATVTITGKGNYTGTKKLTFNIKARSVNELSYTKVKNYTYIGKSITPSVTVKYGSKTLKKNTNYTISYKNNKNVGTATITITGKGNFTGTKKITFKINQRDISSATASGIKTKTYTGSAIKQSISIKYGGKTLKNKTDYTISYKNNVNKGTATITITGKGNFKGTKKVTFKIKAKDIANLSFLKILNRPYTGSAIKPGVTIQNGKITLKNGTDYTIKYSNNVKIGTATISITGKGNYTGTKKIKFKIEKQSYYIKVNYKANVVTIYQKGESGKYDKPIKAMICSTGTDTPKSGKYGTKLKWSWLKMYGNVYGHYVTQITGDILFHSVPYLEKSIDTLEYWEYDKLGTSASMGCVRLTAKDAKWIYDKIPKGTTVEFYSSSNPGPLGKPEAMKISSYKEYRNWDPTDPSSKNPWKEIL